MAVPILNLPQISPGSNSILRAEQTQLASLQNQALQQKIAQQRQQGAQSQTLQALKLRGINDPKARAIATQLDPAYGAQLQDYQLKQQEFEAKKAVYWGNQAQAVTTAPLASRPTFYKNLYGKAESAGEDVTIYPLPSEEWTDAHQQTLEYIAQSSIPAKNALEAQQKQQIAERNIKAGTNLPSDVRSYQFYKNLAPQEQQDFLNVKRDVYRTGLTTDKEGNVIAIPGAPQAKSSIKEAESYGTASGKVRAEAETELPVVEQNADYAIKLIDELIEHPGMKSSVGVKNPFSGAAPMVLGLKPVEGTKSADFMARLEQIKGKQFLEAFENLKGGGQITEVEGEKATQAISRMGTAQSENEFIAAAREFQDIVKRGRKRARNKVNKRQPNRPSNTGSQYQEGQTATNPTTGITLTFTEGKWQ